MDQRYVNLICTYVSVYVAFANLSFERSYNHIVEIDGRNNARHHGLVNIYSISNWE
jgi:hypothetical protein